MKHYLVGEGTISVLIGTHSIIHSIMVARSWRILYKSNPRPWELVCILIHDIGHIGLDYLSNYEQKKVHWVLGANLAKRIFGQKGYDLIRGHCTYQGQEPSRLYKPDKYSFYVSPKWWLTLNALVEPKLHSGESITKHVDKFRKWVKESIESGEYRPTHESYLERTTNRRERP